MPSLVTGIIGGIQGASASHNAANALAGGYNKAGDTVTQAAAGVNPGITAAGTAAGAGATGASGAIVNNAGAAAGNVNALATQAGTGVSPYTAAGATAAGTLQSGMAPGGALNKPFDASMMESQDPGYEFRLQQGQQAMQRAQAAGGVAGGGASRALEGYAQNAASGEYQNAFNNYQTQQNATFNRLATTAGMGQQASEYAGTTGVQAGEYGGTLGLQAGQSNLQANEFAGTADMNSTDLAAQNTLQSAVYQGNTQIGAGKAIATGDMNAANAWNGMLGSIGNAGNALLTGGLNFSLPTFRGNG